jgi:hypothetical protein
MERLAGNEGGGGKSEEQKGQPRNKQLLLCKEANNACAMSKTARVLRLGQAWSRVVSWYGSAESNLYTGSAAVPKVRWPARETHGSPPISSAGS